MSAAARSCRVPPGLLSPLVCRASPQRARRRSPPKVSMPILRSRPTAGLRFSQARSISAPAHVPRSVRLLPRSFRSRRRALRSLKVTPHSRLTKDRPEAQPASWSAACKYGKRRRPRARICWRSARRGSIVLLLIWKRATARSQAAAAAKQSVLLRSSVARPSTCRSTNRRRYAIRILIRLSAPRIRALTFRRS